MRLAVTCWCKEPRSATPTVRLTTNHQENGVYVQSIAGSITFQDSTGTVQSVQVTGHDASGVSIQSGGTTAAFTSGDYFNNGGDGIYLNSFSGAVALTGVTADGNGAQGLDVNDAGALSVSGGSFSGNTAEGIRIDDVTGVSSITGATIQNNGTDGIGLTAVGVIEVTANTFSGNTDSDLEVNATSLGDTITVNATLISFGSTAVTIDGTVGVAHVDSLEGEDEITLTPSVDTIFLIDGGDPVAPATPGDVLNFITPGVQTATLINPGPDSGTIQTTGLYQDVDFDEIERLNFGGNVVVNGTGEDDLLVIDATGADTGTFQLTTDVDGSNGGPEVGPIVGLAGVTKFTFNGFAGNDAFRINNPAVGLFGPVDGIVFNGGDDSDLLQVLGGTGANGSYTVGPAGDEGTLVASDGTTTQTITFTGLEPIEHTTTLGTFGVNASSSGDTINIVDGRRHSTVPRLLR